MMLKKRLVFAGLALALGFGQLPVQAATELAPVQSVIAEKGRVTNEAEGFSIKPPKGWEKGPYSDQYFMMFLGPARDNFAVNLNVNSIVDDNTPLESLGDQIKAHYPTQFNNWELGEEGTTKIDGNKSYYISSKFTMQGNEYQNLQYFIPGTEDSGKFYIVTFTCLAKDYSSYSSIFKKTAKSIEVFDIEEDEDV